MEQQPWGFESLCDVYTAGPYADTTWPLRSKPTQRNDVICLFLRFDTPGSDI